MTACSRYKNLLSLDSAFEQKVDPCFRLVCVRLRSCNLLSRLQYTPLNQYVRCVRTSADLSIYRYLSRRRSVHVEVRLLKNAIRMWRVVGLVPPFSRSTWAMVVRFSISVEHAPCTFLIHAFSVKESRLIRLPCVVTVEERFILLL